MTTLLLSMVLACGENGDENGNNDDPRWFEAGTYDCSSTALGSEGGPAFCNALTLTLDQTGSISNYKIHHFDYDIPSLIKQGECRVGESATPDESVWSASCDGLERVLVYSEGFEIGVSWIKNDEFYEMTFE